MYFFWHTLLQIPLASFECATLQAQDVSGLSLLACARLDEGTQVSTLGTGSKGTAYFWW